MCGKVIETFLSIIKITFTLKKKEMLNLLYHLLGQLIKCIIDLLISFFVSFFPIIISVTNSKNKLETLNVDESFPLNR